MKQILEWLENIESQLEHGAKVSLSRTKNGLWVDVIWPNGLQTGFAFTHFDHDHVPYLIDQARKYYEFTSLEMGKGEKE